MPNFKVKPIIFVLVFSALMNSCSHDATYAPVMPTHQHAIHSVQPVKPLSPKKHAKTKAVKAISSTKSARSLKPDKQQAIEAGTKYYVVQKNDTLYSIGLRSGHGYERLALWNKLIPSYHVVVGQKLKLFNPKQDSISARNKPEKKYIPKVRSGSQKRPKNGIRSQKNPNNSIANAKVLKLNWQWPIRGRVVKNFSQSGNKGIDIHGQIGQKVQAAEAGKVVYSGKGLLGYGNLLIIKHNELFLSAYANNSQLRVTEGQMVGKGQVVAEVGKAGTKRAALHFEIRKNGKSVNPLKYLPKK